MIVPVVRQSVEDETSEDVARNEVAEDVVAKDVAGDKVTEDVARDEVADAITLMMVEMIIPVEAK